MARPFQGGSRGSFLPERDRRVPGRSGRAIQAGIRSLSKTGLHGEASGALELVHPESLSPLRTPESMKQAPGQRRTVLPRDQGRTGDVT